MEREIAPMSTGVKIPLVKGLRELRGLDRSVQQARLGGEALSRYENPDHSVGGWVSEKAIVNPAKTHLHETAIVLGESKIGVASVGKNTVIIDCSVNTESAMCEYRHAEIGDYVYMKKSRLLGDNKIGNGVFMYNAIVFAGMAIGGRSVIENARIELTKSRAIPENAVIRHDIIHSDLDVVQVEVLPIRSFGNIDEKLDKALGIRRR
jgi:carbonic anhydrase/acetyltransferase-like protein (isoleucine patch superfamily)